MPSYSAKWQAAVSFETSANMDWTICHHILEENNLNYRHCKNLKFHNYSIAKQKNVHCSSQHLI